MAIIYSILEVADRLGLAYTRSFNAKCPFCGSRTKSLHLETEINAFRCNKCDAHGGALNLFARLQLGWETIPSDKRGLRDLAAQLRAFMGDADAEVSPRPRPKRPAAKVTRVASDTHLNAVYTAMAQIPELALTQEHRENLRRRGLTDDAIDSNGYRTLPERFKAPTELLKFYDTIHGEELRKKICSYKYSKARVLFGLYVAFEIQKNGLALQGVPGFFKFGDYWCLYYTPGILIPTRNMAGQIVIYQVRRKKGEPKYMTLSCSSMPGAVNSSVSRCHFPLCNSTIGPDTPLIVTEGPLKADVACSMMRKPVAFAAIPGINTTKDLLSYVSDFQKLGVNVIWNGLDMDKLTNPNVAKGEANLNADFEKRGLHVRNLYWGREYAERKAFQLWALAQMKGLAVSAPPEASVYKRLKIAAKALNDAGFKPCCYTAPNGTQKNLYWESSTKGIDDIQLTLAKSRK